VTRLRKIWLVTIAAIILLSPLGARAQDDDQPVEVLFGWAPSATIDDEGLPCAEAVRYDVYLQKGGAAEEMIDTVTDTFYTLAAERGVLQRVRVVGYDAAGRPSPPSEWSDPVYFDSQRGSQSTPPAHATLRPNYPNPFNPETRIAYGVPEGTPAGTRVALEIFNLRGQRIRSFPITAEPGWHEVTWDGRDDRGQPQATGTYVTRYVCGTRVEVGKMTMVK
jgi:hypothetical protein